MPFLTELKVQPIRGTKKRRLISPLIYEDKVLGRIVAPNGFVSNYASIPEWIPRWVIDQDDPIIRDISVTHDFLYSNECSLDITRYQADNVLYRGMRELGANWLVAKIAFRSVRIAGGSHWRCD